MYLPTKELLEYFETKKDTRFVAIEKYRKCLKPTDEKELISFLLELGIKLPKNIAAGGVL